MMFFFLGLIIVVLIVAPYPSWTTTLKKNHYQSAAEKAQLMGPWQALMDTTKTYQKDMKSTDQCKYNKEKLKTKILNLI